MLNSKYFDSKELELFQAQNPIFNKSQMAFINKKTPKSEIEEKTDFAGNTYKSVKSGYVKALVTLVTGGNYSFEIKEQYFLSAAKEVRTTARLTIYVNDKAYVREQNGKAECSIAEANAYKASASDAFKKCASEFGFCWDIYNQEVSSNKEGEINISHAEKKKLERLDHFLKSCKDADSVEKVYNKYLETAEETEFSKDALKRHMERVIKVK